jgi:hypothetical protein
MLVRVDDVAVGRGEEARDAGDDAGTVRAAEQQARGIDRWSVSETLRDGVG